MTQVITNGMGIPNRILTNGLGIDKVILHYLSEQNIESSCLSDVYIESRECIFGSKSDVLWKPLTKALMMIYDYKKAKGHVEENEYFIDKIEGIINKQIKYRFFMFKVLIVIVVAVSTKLQYYIRCTVIADFHPAQKVQATFESTGANACL